MTGSPVLLPDLDGTLARPARIPDSTTAVANRATAALGEGASSMTAYAARQAIEIRCARHAGTVAAEIGIAGIVGEHEHQIGAPRRHEPYSSA